jgi:excisionase family DNA binding protein
MTTALTDQTTQAAALLDVEQVAQTLNCSPRHIYRLSDAGKMPRPVRLGSLVRWNREVLDEWISSGCPDCRKAGK